ncbi:DUF4192 family protein [Microbacterium sp. ASV49]|uniref:DUF4192 family protein n=1 Tax=Microbacterium candidum TaxID=3041922 RepID=A0ABT7MUX9_9MICO|nr:DUF4192 family protein [Microbacterium sp. ASV49]MDL9978257.1 DUF4192 family protein [Microbacterium sp. ASV49]
MTTIVRAKGAAHFLSLVPSMLGFTPSESLVLIPFERGRSIGGMRFDLPASDEPADAVDRIAATIIGMVCRVAQADAFAVVVYTDAPYGSIGEPPQAALAASLLAKADACGLTLTDALCVAVDAWGSYVDPDCPDDGRPLELLPGSRDLGVGRLDRDQAAGAELPASEPTEREQVARAVDSLTHAVLLVTEQTAETDARIDPAALSALCALNDLPLLFETALDWHPASLDPFDAASMIYCLARPALRDVALAQWCDDLAAGDAALDAQLRWEEGDGFPDELACRMWGEGAQPSPDRLRAALELCRRLAAVAPEAAKPGPLAVCAWLSWALGRSTHAEVYSRQALEIEPEHGLSEIVLAFVMGSHLPDWAFQRPTRPALASAT